MKKLLLSLVVLATLNACTTKETKNNTDFYGCQLFSVVFKKILKPYL